MNLIPDGVANFYETSTSPYERSMRLKRAIAPLLGLSFRPYRGNYLALGIADYEAYWFFGSPGMMGGRLPLREFPAPARPTIDTRVEGLLFLGQPDSGHPAFAEKYLEVLTAAAARESRIFYKPHPSEKFDPERQRDLERLGFEVVDTAEPAERLAATYTSIAGVASSVLFNVRLLGWNDDVLCVGDPDYLMILLGRNGAEVKEILESARVAGLDMFFPRTLGRFARET